jgi:predicted MFS family arabinose efflux permease
MTLLSRRDAVLVFLAFAFSYFISALMRGITATLSPTLTQEFTLNARDLGLLAGGYFLGFSVTQLPLGKWLDRHGPKKVVLSFLAVAVGGCVAFSLATSFSGLLAARVLSGVGVSACLMAALTGYRHWFDATTQIRANSWMLMTGSMGMVASTLPVQWLMPLFGWRPLFWVLAGLLLLSMAALAWRVPRWRKSVSAPAGAATDGYALIWRHPFFRRLMPVGFFSYGGLLAMQTLWAGPWMVKVAGYTPLQSATGLFWINVTMLGTFWTWGLVNPWLVRRGLSAPVLIARGLPLSFVVLAVIIVGAERLGGWTAAAFALYCMTCTFVSLSQPAIGMAFPQEVTGRALSAYNLVIFAGVFVMQWGIGLLIDLFQALGLAQIAAFQGAWTVFLACCIGAYLYFVAARPDNQKQ